MTYNVFGGMLSLTQSINLLQQSHNHYLRRGPGYTGTHVYPVMS